MFFGSLIWDFVLKIFFVGWDRWEMGSTTGYWYFLNQKNASVEMVFFFQKDGFVLTKPVFRFVSYGGFLGPFSKAPPSKEIKPKIRSQEFCPKKLGVIFSHGWEWMGKSMGDFSQLIFENTIYKETEKTQLVLSIPWGIWLGLQWRVGFLGVSKGATNTGDDQKIGLSGSRTWWSWESVSWRKMEENGEWPVHLGYLTSSPWLLWMLL